MRLDLRGASATLVRAAVMAAALGVAPAYAACTTGLSPVSIGPITTGSGLGTDTFDGPAFVISGAVTGDGLFFEPTTSGDPLAIDSHATVDSTGGAAGNEGIFIEGDFGDICYDGAANATMRSLSDGLSIDQLSDGDVILDVAHSIDAGGIGVLVTHDGNGNVGVATTGNLTTVEGGIVVDHEGETGNIDITTAAGTAIVATGGSGSFLLPGPTGIAAIREVGGPGPVGSGGITIVNGADITADVIGIYTDLCGCVDGEVNITSTGNIDAFLGVYVASDGDAHVDIKSGTITAAAAGVAIAADNVKFTLGDAGQISMAATGIGLSVSAFDTADVTIAGTIQTTDAPAVAIDGTNARLVVAGVVQTTGIDPAVALLTTDSADVTVSGTIQSSGAPAIDILAGGNTALTLLPGFSITGDVLAGGGPINKLVFGGTGTASFDLDNIGPAAQYQFFDTFEKSGSSTWRFSGSTFAGQLSVKGGTAKIDTEIPGLDVTLAGGEVGGNGSFGLLSGSGVIAPGNSIGTLTVTSADIGAGSAYEVELNAAGANDKLISTGGATISGGAMVLAEPETGHYDTVTKYTILTAAGPVTGHFGGASSASPFFIATLSDDTHNVYLTLRPNPTAHGDAFASLATALIDDDRYLREAVLDRLLSGRNTPGTVTAPGLASDAAIGDIGAGSGAWARGYGGLLHLPGTATAPSIDASTGGLIIGGDEVVGNTRLGALLASGATAFTSPSRGLSGTSGDLSAGMYGDAEWDNFYLSFGATFTHHNIAATRTVPVTGDTFHSLYGAITSQAFAEAGYEVDMGATSLTPFAGAALVNNSSQGFTETGPAGNALTVAPYSTTALISSLGLRLEHQFVLGDNMLVTLSGSAAWRHAFGGTTATSNTFVGVPAFQAIGAPLPADALLLAAGAELDVNENLDIGLTYSGSIDAGGGSHALTATLTGKF